MRIKSRFLTKADLWVVALIAALVLLGCRGNGDTGSNEFIASTQPAELESIAVAPTDVSTSVPVPAQKDDVTEVVVDNRSASVDQSLVSATAIATAADGAVPAGAHQMEICSDLTGHCRVLEYHEPVSLVIPCEHRVFALELVRESGAETMATCRPGVSTVSGEELEKLLTSPRAESQPATIATVENDLGLEIERVMPRAESEPAPLGTVFVREDLAIEIKRVIRSDEDIDPFCAEATEEQECLTVNLEMTNLSEDGGELHYDSSDFTLAGAGENVVKGSSGTVTYSVIITPARDPVVLQAGERLVTTVVRRIPKNAGEIVLEYQNRGPILFDLGSEDDWSKTPADALTGRPDLEDLTYEMECGFVFEYVKKTTGDRESSYSKDENVVAICDPDVATVRHEELNELRKLGDPEGDGRLEQTVLGDVLKDGDLAIRVVAVRRQPVSSNCGAADAPPGNICIGVELEITNLGTGNAPIWHEDTVFQLIDGSGIVFAHGPPDHAAFRYFDQRVGIPPGGRLTTRVVRYVPDDASGLMLVYVGGGESSMLLLDEDATPVAKTAVDQVPPPVKGMLDGPGNWLGGPAPVGVALDVYGLGVRVLEVQRGWVPGDTCCEEVVPSTLLAFKLGRAMIGTDRETADAVIAQQGAAVTEHEGNLEYVRVSLEATLLGSADERSGFNAANLFLVDDKRRVYLSGFYPFAERSLRKVEFPEYSHNLFYGLRKSDRVGELFGGGKIEEEIAWLVPRDATGLTLVYVPFIHAAGGFMALEKFAGTMASPMDRSWAEDALPVDATSESSPAPQGVAGWFDDDVAVRVTEVERLPSPCFEGQSALAGHDCLKIAVQIASEPSEKPRTLFGHFKHVLVIDGQEVPLFYDDRGIWNPEFDSFLDWAEINGRGVMTAVFRTEVPAGWRDAVFMFGRKGLDSLIYLSLNQR